MGVNQYIYIYIYIYIYMHVCAHMLCKLCSLSCPACCMSMAQCVGPLEETISSARGPKTASVDDDDLCKCSATLATNHEQVF
jgi:hypothetical protein